MNYIKATILTLSAAMLAFSCRPAAESDTLVSAAVRLEAAAVRSNSVDIEMQCRQSNVVSYIVTPPAPAADIPYLDMDAVGKYEYIRAHGKVVAERICHFDGLVKQSEYVVGGMGMDAAGNVVSAPYFMKFTTPDLALAVTAGFEKLSGGGYVFRGNIDASDPSVSSYRYIFDKEHSELETEALVSLLKAGGPEVKTGSGSQKIEVGEDSPATYILAGIPYDEAGQTGELVVAFASSETLVTIDYNGAMKMNRPDKSLDRYELVFEAGVPAEFTVTVNGEQYGFVPYSGAGGVGTVTVGALSCAWSAYPSYSAANKDWPLAYEVSKARGRMSRIEEGGKKFFVNCSGRIRAIMDFTAEDNIPRYCFERIDEDASVVFHEDFSLFVWSGDYMNAANGTQISTDLNYGIVEGTEAGEKQEWNLTNALGANKNEVAMKKVFDYPELSAASQPLRFLASESYIRNRGFENWTAEAIGERPGCVQLSIAGAAYYGKLTTPCLEGAPSHIVVEVDLARMSTSSTKALGVEIVGSGHFVSAELSRDEYHKYVSSGTGALVAAASSSYTTTDGLVPATGGSASGFVSERVFAVKTDLCPKSENNSHLGKPHSHLKLVVDGAASDTRICFNTALEGKGSDAGNTRMFIFDIKITK